jgi:heme-degrading monooxygenase HmoA
MIVVTNRIPVAKGQEPAFEERFRNRAGLVEGRPGFRDFQLLRPLHGDAYLVMTWWDTEADFRAWTESPEFQEAHRNRPPRELFAGPSVFEMHEVIQHV